MNSALVNSQSSARCRVATYLSPILKTEFLHIASA